MHLRNGRHGYGAVTKLLHWLTVAAFAGQFLVGYSMATDADVADVDCDPPGEDRGTRG
jgi:cytochrome b561